jgi:hypothetical protein
VQRATAQSKTGFFSDYVVAQAPPGFQAGWSDFMFFFFFSLFVPINYTFKGRIETNENRRRAGGAGDPPR